jgi:hypothetical protein
MMPRALNLTVAIFANILLLPLCAILVQADDELKTINEPGGGQITYGSLTGQKTLQGAMQFILRNVHGHFGDSPDTGRFFQTSDGQSMATFFTLKAKNQGGKKLAGLVIVCMPAAEQAKAAVITDSADRFAQSEPLLMKKLTDAWRADVGGGGGGSNLATETTQAEVMPLHEASTGDMSASIGLPEGWKLTGVSAGALHAVGPHGETVNLGVMIQNIYDPRNPQSQRMMQYLRMGHNPFVVCARGNNLAQDYVEVTRQVRMTRHLPQATINVIDCQPATPSQYESQAAMITANIDLNEGQGVMFARIRVGAMRQITPGCWAMTLSGQMVPRELVAQEWPTIKAMVASYKQNGQIIFAEAQSVIDDIHVRAAAAKQRADAFQASNDAHNRSVEARWDQQARDNKMFENYQLDRTIVQDSEQNTHITTGYSLGDALVNSNPGRFQYLPKANLVKGVDF